MSACNVVEPRDDAHDAPGAIMSRFLPEKAFFPDANRLWPAPGAASAQTKHHFVVRVTDGKPCKLQMTAQGILKVGRPDHPRRSEQG